MGNTDTKIQFRKAIVQLTSKTSAIDAKDDEFWDQFWSDSVNNVHDVFALIPAAEIRILREESPSNLATLVYKAVERLVRSTDTLCNTSDQQIMVLNSCRILTRVLPYIFEDPDWRGFFWSKLSTASSSATTTTGHQSRHHDEETDSEAEVEADSSKRKQKNSSSSGQQQQQQQKIKDKGKEIPLAHSLITALCDLLFCPDFTVPSMPLRRSGRFGSPDSPPDDLQSIDSCEYIWESGVGFTSSVRSTTAYDNNRIEILRLLLTCFSSCMYITPHEARSAGASNKWIEFFTSGHNRHALPLFTSLLNTVISYDPNGVLPFNHLIFSDAREQLVDVCMQILIVTLDYDYTISENQESMVDHTLHDNLFINYLARIHREEDFCIIMKGLSRLLNNPLQQTYLPNSVRRIQFHQELLVLFWKFCDYNKKFMYFVLKSNDVLDVLVPILFHLNESRSDQSRIGLVHIGVFILLLLSGERNFGVRLNKTYNSKVLMDVPVFSGSHADLMMIVFHKLITAGHQRLQPLFDCLLTIIVNVSPYLKSLSMVSATKLLHLMEAFSTPWFLYSNPTNHHLVFFLLEIFNNMIQYQFDGNSNLIYTIIRKRVIFHNLSNLSTDANVIQRSLNKNPNAKKSLSSTTLVKQQLSIAGTSGTTSQATAASTPTTPTTDVSKSFPSLAPGNTIRIQSQQSCPSPASTNSSSGSTPRPNSVIKSPERNSNSRTGVRELQHPLDASFDDVFGSSLATLAATPKLNKMTEMRHAHTDPDPDSPLIDDMNPSSQSPKNATATTTSGQEHICAASSASHSINNTSSRHTPLRRGSSVSSSISSKSGKNWSPTPEWVQEWKSRLPLQTIMRMLQVLVPQVEKMCIDKGITEESEILKFLQHGTLVGLLPVPHPILIRKYQTNAGTTLWFRTYMWGVIYLRNSDPAIWYDTNVQLFEIQKI